MTLLSYFSVMDYAFMAFYVVVLIFLGFFLQKLASKSLDNYICGAGNIPWWAMGISGMASFLDLAGTAIIVSFLFMMGPQGLFIEFRGGAVLVLVFMMLWTGKWHRRSGCVTGAQWNIFRFGDCWGGRASQLMGVIATVLTTIGMLAYLIVGAGSFLATFLPYSPFTLSVILLVLATAYTMMAGFYGVIYTDMFQVAIIMAAVIYLSVKGFMCVTSAEEINAIAMQVTGNPTWASGLPAWEVHVPKGYEAYKHLGLFTTFYLIRTIVAGVGTGADPRYFGAKNDRECAKLSMLWTFLMMCRWPMMMGMAVLGLYLVNELIPNQSLMTQAAAMIHAQFPSTTSAGWAELIASISNTPGNYPAEFIASLKGILGDTQWSEKMNLLSFDGTVNPEKILPAVLLMSVAKGMRGILVIALIAAALSTFGSWVNLATSQFVNDFYKKWIRPAASTRELIFASWGTVIAVVGCSLLFSRSLASINDIWGWMMMGFGAGFLVPSFLRLYWWRANGAGSAIGTLIGLVAACLQRWSWPHLTKWADTNQEGSAAMTWIYKLLTEYSEITQFVLILTIAFVGTVIATLLTEPTDPEVLKNMYMKTRPFGVWGHLKKTLSVEEQAKVSLEHRTDLLAVPFALTWQISLFLSPMLLIVHNWPEFWIVTIVGIVAFLGLYFFWFRNQPKTNFYED